MAEVKNIIVGAADVQISTGDTRPTASTLDSTIAAISSTASFSDAALSGLRKVGLTTGGVEFSYAPNYGEVTVDQLLDAARLFKQSMQVMVRTTLSEGTLENMNVAFGQKDSQLVVSSASSKTILSIGGSALGEAPQERTIVFVGQAPKNLGKNGSTFDSTATKKERVYIARRAVQMETVSHSLRRDGATEFPVNFRCLSDSDVTDGSDYGKIIDRVYGA